MTHAERLYLYYCSRVLTEAAKHGEARERYQAQLIDLMRFWCQRQAEQ